MAKGIIRLKRLHLEIDNCNLFLGWINYSFKVYPSNLVLFPYRLTNFFLSPVCSVGIPASSGNTLDSVQDDNPPHWLKSLQALTEMDGPSAASSQPHHSAPFSTTQTPLHRASWNPYPPPSNPPSFHSPPPGFQTAFRPPSKTPTDLLQSSTLDRH